jgi:hypothetical protein
MNSITVLIIVIGLIIIGSAFMVYITEKLDNRAKYKLILNVEYMQKTLNNFMYKGKEINLKLVTENITPKHFDCSYNKIFVNTLYINNNPIVSVWKFNTLHKKYEIISNSEYDTSDLYSLLRKYKKEADKVWSENYDKLYKKSHFNSMY